MTGVVHPSSTVTILDVWPPKNGSGVPSASSGSSPPVPARPRNNVPSAPQVKPRGLVRPLATTSMLESSAGVATGLALWPVTTAGSAANAVRRVTTRTPSEVLRYMTHSMGLRTGLPTGGTCRFGSHDPGSSPYGLVCLYSRAILVRRRQATVNLPLDDGLLGRRSMTLCGDAVAHMSHGLSKCQYDRAGICPVAGRSHEL